MYTSHHPCWDAKNRYGLPEELPFDYGEIATVIELSSENSDKTTTLSSMTEATITGNKEVVLKQTETVPDYIVLQQSREEKVSKALLDLMISNRVTEWDIQNAVGEKGYFPSDMPIEQYPESFIQGCLIAAWPKVYEMIKNAQKELDRELPFMEGE